MLAGLTSTEERQEVEAYIRHCEKRGKPVPDDMRQQVASVEVDDEHRDIMQAFLELSGARGTGYDRLLPIACRDVEAWLRINGTDRGLRPMFWRVLRRVDQAFLARVNK